MACNFATTSVIARWARARHDDGCERGPTMLDVGAVRDYMTGLQQRIVAGLEAIDGQPFRRETWSRPEGGGGVACVLEEGGVFERAGVNFSHVKGAKLPPS